MKSTFILFVLSLGFAQGKTDSVSVEGSDPRVGTIGSSAKKGQLTQHINSDTEVFESSVSFQDVGMSPDNEKVNKESEITETDEKIRNNLAGGGGSLQISQEEARERCKHEGMKCEEREGKVVGIMRTLVLTVLTTTTTTKGSICAISGFQSVCKRRRRMIRPPEDIPMAHFEDYPTSVPQLDPPTLVADDKDIRNPKKIFKLLASITTVTFTSTSFSKTFSISFLCSVIGMSTPSTCG